MPERTRPANIDNIGTLLEELASTRLALDEALRKNAEERLRARDFCAELALTIKAVRAQILADTPRHKKVLEAQKALNRLTLREREVLRLIAEGYSTKQIAAELYISFKTAVSHRTNILEKLGVHESATLVRLAVTAGIVAA